MFKSPNTLCSIIKTHIAVPDQLLYERLRDGLIFVSLMLSKTPSSVKINYTFICILNGEIRVCSEKHFKHVKKGYTMSEEATISNVSATVS